jgi:Kef-type K+ transport system membrane component KefB/mannitol/fructose-specific phosphotransferase system IIA component (Ntr-type)
MQFLSEQHLFLFLLQFLIILGMCRGLGQLFQRVKQPTITADLLVGILLGPTVLGRYLPGVSGWLFPPDMAQRTMLETVAWIGILFLLLDTGLEVNFSNVWRQRRRALKISVLDLCIPILLAGLLIYYLPFRYGEHSRLLFTLFLATIMTLSAMPVAIRAMHDLGILKTEMGFLIISALSINDVVGWMVFTVILGVVTSAGLSALSVGMVVAATAAFAGVSLVYVRRLSDRVITGLKKRQPEPSGLTITFISLVGMACGAITQRIGIHSLFGFFIAGLAVGEARDLTEWDRNVFSKLVYAIFVPVFFANLGLKLDFAAHFDLPLVVFIAVIGIGARYIAAWLGAAWAGRPRSNRPVIAVAHVPGGEMHLVIGLLALEYGLISERVFVAVVSAAVFSSIILGPWLSSALARRKKLELGEYLPGTGALVPVESDDLEGVVRLLCEAAARHVRLPADFLAGQVLERERLMSTAVGRGVAFPHARLEGLRRPLVLVGRSENGVPWNAPDRDPVRLIFLILTPLDDRDVQVQILASLASLVGREGFTGELLRRAGEREVAALLKSGLGGSGAGATGAPPGSR